MNLYKRVLQDIWKEVPPDYYQKGVKKNILQRTWHKGKLKTILSFIEDYPQSILDVGCASGWFLNEVSRKFPKAECTGIDPYEDAIKYGKKKYEKLNLIVADGHDIPLPSSTFDLVICSEVLEHVANPEKVVGEIKRVMAPNGIALIEMDSGNILFRMIWYWWTHMRKGVWQHAHLHSFNAKKLEKIIKKGGLIIVEKKVFNFTMAVTYKTKKKS
ncbi:MAG: class I SAM-dependent methyltransferase [Candidatus Levybacteria bacterium]|nr:class I SAM-dependent methyltransferase [Candidatus Levybacteria bacterium]